MSATISKPSNQNQEVTKSSRHWPQACHATSNRGGRRNPSNQKNAYTPVKIDPSSDYVTPGAFELEQLFWSIKGAEYTHVNEVWPRLFIGDEKTALERPHLEMMGMTHVLNAAEGKWNSVDTGALFYQGMNIQYHGVQAQDVPSFNLAQFFQSAVDFMHQALNNPESKVLVHCVMGRSRSATLVLAYLMIHEGLSVVEAIKHVRRKRCVLPNRGFIKQLRALDIALQRDRQKARETDKSLAC